MGIKKFLFGGINRRLIFIFLIVALIPIIVLIYINFSSEIGKNALEKTHFDNVWSIVELNGIEIETFFEERNMDIVGMQNNFNIKTNLPIIKQYVNNKNNPLYIQAKKDLDNELKVFQEENDFLLDVLLLGPKGNIMYVTGNVHKDDEIGTRFFNEDVIKEGIKHIHFSEVFESPFYEGFELLMSAPIKDDNGNLVGIVVFGIDMTSLYDLIQDYTGLGETGETLIGRKMKSHVGKKYDGHFTNRTGEHALFLNPLRHDPDAALRRAAFFSDKNAFPIKEAVQGRKGVNISIDYRSESVIAAWRPLELPSHDLKWGIVAKIDVSEAFASVDKLKRQNLFVGGMIALLVIIVSIFIARSISRPIFKLSNATEELGKGNFNARVDIKTGDELEQLGMTFNRMASALGRLKEEHKQIDRAKTEFLSITSHELRSPMTPMRAQLQMVMKGYLGKINSKQRNALDIVLRNTTRLDNIIIDLLEVSRIEAARLKFIFKKVSLKPYIERLVREMSGFMPEKKIEITTNIGRLPIIEVDPDRVMQVLRNLINNAKKFSSSNKKIFIEVKPKGKEILFIVRDQGIGISSEEQKRIFEPFFQAEQTIYRKKGGTGLGLAISKGIVESQDGKIWLKSEKGKGTSFYFTVPLKPVKEIKPIKLLFSSKENIKKKIKDLFIKILGPIGTQEFESLIEKKKLTKENLFKYVNLLIKQGIISKEKGDIFKSNILFIFRGDGVSPREFQKVEIAAKKFFKQVKKEDKKWPI